MTDKRISVAPMMGMTDRHFRFMASLLCEKISLYTPMIHVDAILKSEKNFLEREKLFQLMIFFKMFFMTQKMATTQINNLLEKMVILLRLRKYQIYFQK